MRNPDLRAGDLLTIMVGGEEVSGVVETSGRTLFCLRQLHPNKDCFDKIWPLYSGVKIIKWERPQSLPKPRTITLCGSTRFSKTFDEVNQRLSIKGYCVFAPSVTKDSPFFTPENKMILDKMYLQKIDQSQCIVVIDKPTSAVCSGVIHTDKTPYIGDSTKNELDHAIKTKKKIFYLGVYNYISGLEATIAKWYQGQD